MILTRLTRGMDGIFGTLESDDGKFKSVTLEHAYMTYGVFNPKVYPGKYPCVLGDHRLLGMHKSFQTYAVCGIHGHSGILFHPGNSTWDSAGCILLGEEIVGEKPKRTITNSKETFDRFMNYMQGIGNFHLLVQNKYEENSNGDQSSSSSSSG
jgi:hypothetical protein